MKSIIINTLKISVAAILAILCAQALKLDFAVSAGIVAILSVQPTKKETLRTALARLLAFAVALAISITFFNLMGFTVPVFFIYLAIFILICQWRKWISAMAMDSVLISHFLSFGKTGLTEIKNETDEQIKLVLHRMALRIQNPDLADYDGSCFDSLNQSIFTAKKQAEENYNNQFSKKDTYDTRYLEMRENQTKILYELFKAAHDLVTVPATASMLSNFLEKISVEYHKDNDVKALLDELAQIHDKMKNVPLPQTRTEFEDRANLFTLMERLKDFLQIKRDFMLSISDGTV